MRLTLPLAFAALALVSVRIAAQQAPIANAPTLALHKLEDDYWQWRLREFPEGATWLGDKRYNDRLTDLTSTGIERRKADIRRFRDAARAIDAKGLAGQDALSHALLQWELDLAVEGQRFPTEVSSSTSSMDRSSPSLSSHRSPPSRPPRTIEPTSRDSRRTRAISIRSPRSCAPGSPGVGCSPMAPCAACPIRSRGNSSAIR